MKELKDQKQQMLNWQKLKPLKLKALKLKPLKLKLRNPLRKSQ